MGIVVATAALPHQSDESHPATITETAMHAASLPSVRAARCSVRLSVGKRAKIEMPWAQAKNKKQSRAGFCLAQSSVQARR
jgi:hypothetical protein